MREIGQLRCIRSAETDQVAPTRFDETRSCDCGKTRNEFQRRIRFENYKEMS